MNRLPKCKVIFEWALRAGGIVAVGDGRQGTGHKEFAICEKK